MTTSNAAPMVSVPVEPTDAMIEAAQAIDNEMFAHGAMHGADANQIYRAMLTAALAQQANKDAPKASA